MAGASRPFELPEDGDWPGEGDWREVRRLSSPRDKTIHRLLTDQGKSLFERVFEGDLFLAYHAARQLARDSGSWFRLQFSFDHAPEAADLPWEALVGPEGFALARLPEVSIERRLVQTPSAEKPLSSGGAKIRVLVAGASPRDMSPIDVPAETKWIRAALGKSAQVKTLRHTTQASLSKEMAADEGFDQIHFFGHGDFEDEEGGLWLEDGAGGGARLSSRELPATLRRPVSFVFLNVCHGGRTSEKPLAGLAEALLRSGVRAVVAMRREISDQGAVSLAKLFYKYVAQGESLTRALALARCKVETPHHGDWAVPVLYLAGDDFALVPPAPTDEPKRSWRPNRRHWSALLGVPIFAIAGWFWFADRCVPPAVPLDERCPMPRDLTLPMVFVKAGSFEQGSRNGQSNERPVHSVQLTKDYCLGAFEVTVGQYAKIMDSKAPAAKKAWLPKEDVPWDRAQAFVRELNRREPNAHFYLPSEAQWEFAARAGLKGDEAEAEPANCDDAVFSDGFEGAACVGSFPPNAWGLYDMKGNLWEWVEDFDTTYGVEPQVDPRGKEQGEKRMRRGGGYTSAASNCRITTRNGVYPHRKQEAAGFRIARDPVR